MRWDNGKLAPVWDSDKFDVELDDIKSLKGGAYTVGKNWNEMTQKELEQAFLQGSIRPGPGGGEAAIERLRILWRREDSQMAMFAKKISLWAVAIAGLTFLATMGWWIWTVYVWLSKS